MGLFKSLSSLFTSSDDAAATSLNNTDATNKDEINIPAVEKTVHTTNKNTDGLITEYVFDEEVKIGTKIKVNHTELFAITKDGVIVELFRDGEYVVNDTNLSKFASGVCYTISLLERTNKWSTNEPIAFTDKDCGEVLLRAFGTYNYSLWDPARIFTDYLNADDNFSLPDYTGSLVVDAFKKVIQNYNGSSYTQLNAKEISNAVKDELRATGFNFTVQIQMIKPTEESEAAIKQAMQNKFLNN